MAHIQYKDGKTDRINLEQPLHLDYALVSTTYSSQGKTAERVLISAAAERTLSQESFNVAISRAKIDLQVYAEDKDKLLELAQKSTAKENPLELLRQQVKERVAAEPVVRASQPVEQKEFDGTMTQNQATPIANNLQTLIENLTAHQHQDFERVMQKLEDVVKPRVPDEQITALALNAIASFIEQAAIESTPIVSTRQTLNDQLSHQSNPDLSAAMQLLETIVAGYQAPQLAQALATEALPIAEAIADSGKQTAINSAIAQSPEIVAPPFERTSEKPTRGEISAQPDSQPPTSRENELPTDMAALFRAANRKLPSPPDWLVVGKRVHCTDTGWGEVTAIIGARLVVKLDSGELMQIPEWPAAVESKLVSANAITVQKPHVLELSSKSELSLDADPAGDKLAQHGEDENHPRQQERLAVERFTDSELILAEKAVREYVASQPPQPPSLDEQQAVMHEIDRIFSQINSLWKKQGEQVKLAESMQKNPFHAWSLKYDAIVKQVEKTKEAISQSYAQKDQKSRQLQQWSKQTKAYQEWSQRPQTQAMRQLAADLSLPQVQSRLEALKQRGQEGRETALAVQDMFRLTGTKRQPDGSLILDGNNWRVKQLGNTVSVTVKADNREILRVEGSKVVAFEPTPEEREKMQHFREQVHSARQTEQQRQLEAERKQSRGLSL